MQRKKMKKILAVLLSTMCALSGFVCQASETEATEEHPAKEVTY